MRPRAINADPVRSAAHTKHGGTWHPLYTVWMSMRQRCNDPGCAAYPNYGGRGIKVCERWDSFANFRDDVGERPLGGTLERIDNDRGYSPDNCRWASRKEQAQNRRATRLIAYEGSVKSLTEWAASAGLKRVTLSQRIDAGWDFGEALATPVLSKAETAKRVWAQRRAACRPID